MEKRAVILWSILVLLCTLTVVKAEISLQGPSKPTVNLGEDIQITGYVLQEKDMFGLFKFELDCNEKLPLLIKSISLKANAKKEFAETIAINEYLEGTCTITAFIEVGKNKIDEAQSSPFSITRELVGDIKLDKTIVQLGEEINLEGLITKPNGGKIDGSAKITFKKDDTVYLQEAIPVKKGKFAYTYNTQDNPAGTYNVEIEVTDAYNNKQVFLVEDFTILGEIALTAELQKEAFLPGEKIKLTGTAKTGEVNVKEGVVTITFNEQQYEASISGVPVIGGGTFKKTIEIPTTVKSGEHTLALVAEDVHGNRKTGELTLTIIPIPTKLEIITNTASLKPQEKLTIKPTLYDQAEDIIATPIALSMKNAEKDEVFTETIESNTQTELTLPQSAVPGTWKITASALEVETEKEIEVTEVSFLAFTQEGELLTITNTGNIPYKEPLVVFLTTINEVNNKEIVKKLSLKPQESTTINLAVKTQPGTYTVTVGSKTFEQIQITATKRKPLPWKTIILPLLAIIVLAYLLLHIKKQPRRERRRKKHTSHKAPPVHKRYRSEEHHVEKFKQDMKERVERKRKPLKFKFKKSQDEFIMELPKKKETYDRPKELDDYVSCTEKREEPPAYEDRLPTDPFKEESPPEKKKGLFNMFD